MASVVVLRPVLGSIEPQNQDSLNAMKADAFMSGTCEFIPNPWADLFVMGCPFLHTTRNVLIQEAFKRAGWTHALFVDSDMTFPANALKALLGDDKDIVGVQYRMRTEPFLINAWVKEENEIRQLEKAYADEGTHKVAAVGMGLTLVRREVFAALGAEAFSFKEFTGEDIEFCMKAGRKGFETWLNCELLVGHVGKKEYTV
jgi:hypothetical protein